MSSTCHAAAGLPLQPEPRAARRRSLVWLLPLAYFLFVCGEFCLLTSVVLRATAQGHTAFRVGLIGTSLWLGILAATLLAHRVAHRIGSVATFAAGLFTAFAGMLAVLPQPTLLWIVPAMALMGFGGGLAWVSGEALVVETAVPAQRGLVVGVYETGVGLALMAGPALVPLSMHLQLSEAWVAAALGLAGWLLSLCVLRVRLNAAPTPGLAQAPARAHGATWALAAVAALGGMMENGVAGLLPSVSARLDFSLTQAALLGTVMGAGSALMQPPAGRLADRMGLRGTVLAAWGLVLACNLLLLMFASDPKWVLWVAGFGVCGLGGAAYTLVIVELGTRYDGARLVRAVSGSAASYSIGTAIGPAAGGALFDHGGLHLLAVSLCAVAVLAMVASSFAWRADTKETVVSA